MPPLTMAVRKERGRLLAAEMVRQIQRVPAVQDAARALYAEIMADPVRKYYRDTRHKGISAQDARLGCYRIFPAELLGWTISTYANRIDWKAVAFAIDQSPNFQIA